MVETLQHVRDLLIAKSRWEATAEQDAAYVDLRAELLEVPDLKASLPPYVRSSRRLQDFWNYLKNEHPDLKSYKNRTDFIWAGFKPLIAAIEETDGTGGQAFFPKGSDHDAYKHIREILQRANTSILVIDGYMDSTIYQVLATVETQTIRILTSKVPADFSLEGKKFAKQHGGTLDIHTSKDFMTASS